MSLFISVIILWIITAVISAQSIRMNGGKIIYSFDDAYIHMAIAKNFVTNGIWGITRDGFSSCSSSPLWTGLIAVIYFIAGINTITPFILNILSATGILIFSYLILIKEGFKPLSFICISILLIILTPLPFLIFTGLEHVLHILISMILIYLVAVCAEEKETPVRTLLILGILSAALPLLRYEGIAMIIISALALSFNKKWKPAILMIVLSFIPIFLYGSYSVQQGWSFFPNSLSLKGDIPDVVALKDFFTVAVILWNKLFKQLSFLHVSILGFVLLAVIIYPFVINKLSGSKQRSITMLLLFGANIILYILFSQTVWSYRYSSFLVALGIFVFSLLIYSFRFSELRPPALALKKSVLVIVSLLLIYIGINLGIKGVNTIIQTAPMTTNIYEQQYQMGMFLKQYYENKVVALNDIGATNYFADIKCVDLVGISDKEISAVRRQHSFSSSVLQNVAASRNINIAILYDIWFSDGEKSFVPAEWIKVGEWKIQGEVLAGDNTISFYAVNKQEAGLLSENLSAFSGELPGTVIQSGIYLKNKKL
jgi:hypothetical protein